MKLQNNMVEVYDNSEIYDPSDNMTSFSNFSNSWPAIVDVSVDVPAKVGLPTNPPPKIWFDTTVLASKVCHTIDASSGYYKNSTPSAIF